MKLSIQVEADILIPDVPDELECNDGSSLTVANMHENALKKVAAEWTRLLLDKAGFVPKPRATRTTKEED